MKKIIACLICAVMCAMLFASAVSAEEAPSETGGWTLNEKAAEGVDEDAAAVFESATSVLPVSYNLIALLGTQIVSGTNYAFLAIASADFIPEPTLAVVIVYEDLDGNATFTSYAPFTIADILEYGEGESAGESAGDSESAGEEAAETAGEVIVINLMGTDVPVTLAIDGDTFTFAYSFNGNDVSGTGTIDGSGTMTVDTYTPDSVPAMYVQGAITELEDTLAE